MSCAIVPFTFVIIIDVSIQKFNSGLRKKDSPPYVAGTKYRGGVPLEDEFTPFQLVERLNDHLGRKLEAVIDLTFTDRYYDSKVHLCCVCAEVQLVHVQNEHN